MDRFQGYPVFVRTFQVGDRHWELLGPRNYEALIDDPRVAQRFAEDEFMPYWAEFWPASLILAEMVAAWPRPTGRDAPLVLELGCGLGLVSLVAAARGYRVIASDYDDDALAFVRANAERNGVELHAVEFVDWRKTYDLRFDRIIAAEVTYERRHLAPLAGFIRQHLEPTGNAWLVDRNRQVADPFPEVATAAGMDVTIAPATGRDRDGAPVAARVFELRLD